MADTAAGLRELVRHRAGDRCEYCRIPQSAEPLVPFHVEHVTARQHGGVTALPNLAWACQHCNLHKGPNLAGIDPETGRITPLFQPRLDRWDDHFTVGPDGTIAATTAVGRATIAVLGTDAADRRRLRAAGG